jgi:hypothetical protein
MLEINFLRVKNHTHTYQNHTLRESRTLRVEIKLVCVEITLIRNHIRTCHHTHLYQHYTLRVEITVFRFVITFVRVKITMRVKITLCVYKSRSCVSLSHSSVSNSHAYMSKLLLCQKKPHFVCRNRTLRVEINFMRV